jgi:hypothetical protein
MAAREGEVRDHALEAIDEAITKFRSDMQRTQKNLVGGEWVEVPIMLLTPRDVALLIDRFQVLFARPSVISQHQGFNVTSEAPHRGPPGAHRADPSPGRAAAGGLTLPRSPRRLDD